MRIHRIFGILTACSILSAQSVTFVPQSQVSVGKNPVALALGNFTAHATLEGTLDLAVIEEGASMLSVLHGIGNGFFVPFADSSVRTGISPDSVASGDFDHDGRLDLAIANFASNSVSVLLGTGAGRFRTLTTLAARGPTAVAIGDFDRDGNLDLIVTEHNSNTVALFLGNGAGLFATIRRFPVGERPVSVVIADFNRDGKADLAVANRDSNDVSLLLGTGVGTFLAARNFDAGSQPSYLVSADFNRDGKPDVAVANATGFSTGTVSILLGTGDGIFVRSSLTFDVGTNPSFLAAADFNQDGKIDLITANTDSNTISLLLGLGDGTFQPQRQFDVEEGPAWIGITDFNADGRPDLVVANSRSSTVETLINHTGIITSAINSVVNAASGRGGPIAPGEMVLIIGTGFGTIQFTNLLIVSGTVSSKLAQIRVLFDGVPAPLISVVAGQVIAIVPYGVVLGSKTQVVVESGGVTSPALTIPVVDSMPGLFTLDGSGSGPAAILNEDGSVNSASHPAARGSVVALYGTGAGTTNPAGVDGLLAVDSLPQPLLPVSVTIDGIPAEVMNASAAPGQVAGIIQVNVRLPAAVSSGALPVIVQVGDVASQPGVTVNVQ